MLWYKAWREGRVRFLITALTSIAFCVFTGLFEPSVQANTGLTPPLHLHKAAYSEYIYNLIYSGQAKGLFALLVIFLGIGGLQREHSHNTAAFTLALPVSRRRVIGTQIALGAVQLAVLALLPAVLVPSLCSAVHQSFPLSEALHFQRTVVRLRACYLLIFVLPGRSDSRRVHGAHCVLSPPDAPYGSGTMASAQAVPLKLDVAHGTMHWDQSHTFLLPSPLSWTALFVMALISTVLLAMAARVTDRQDF